MQTILLVGLDPVLLNSRAAVLRRTGAKTIVVRWSDAISMLDEQTVDVAVLCHTIPEVICGALIRAFHERLPSILVVRVLPYGKETSDCWEAPADAVSSSRPECLLTAVARVLSPPVISPLEISEWKASLPVY